MPGLHSPHGHQRQPKATEGNRSAENLEINEFISLKSYFPQQLQIHTHTGTHPQSKRIPLKVLSYTCQDLQRAGSESGREGSSCHVYLKAKAGNEICKSTSFNFAFSQNANSKWQIFLLRGINAAPAAAAAEGAAATATATPAEAARLWLGVCPKWRGLLLACPACFFVVAFVVSAARHTLLQVFCNSVALVLVLVHIAVVVGALPPKRQSTFPLAVSGFRYCFHAAIALQMNTTKWDW